MDNPKKQLLEKLSQANNVLVTVRADPSVDQLSAAIGLSLVLNKLGKHATAVFSGNVPDVLEFLDPSATLEKNTDSLRDFIISLDKTKADKLRYKVEDKHVKIFITPYRTSIGQDDLEFSQGDFNVDLVIALGVHEQQDLDQAIIAHGRILHDATVSSMTTDVAGNLGSINWVNTQSSSLCEMVTALIDELKKDILDSQMATALLTGIVAETERFSNEKTSAYTMTASAKLMAAGANQQLVATKLQEKPLDDQPQFDPLAMNDLVSNPDSVEELPAKPSDGSLQIEHEADITENIDPNDILSTDKPESQETPHPEIHIDEHGEVRDTPTAPEEQTVKKEPSRLILQPPTLGGTLTGSTQDIMDEPSTDPLSNAEEMRQPLLSRADDRPEPVAPQPEPQQAPKPVQSEATELPPVAPETPEEEPDQTLADLEQAVESPHVEQQAAAVVIDDALTPDVDYARNAVEDAIKAIDEPPLAPIEALNAQPIDLNLHGDANQAAPASDQDYNFNLPPDLVEDHSAAAGPAAPPPVPPPMLPPVPEMQEEALPQPSQPATPQQPQSNPGNPFNLPPA